MKLSPLEIQLAQKMLKNEFESITIPFPGVYDEFIHLYRLTLKLGFMDLAKEFDSDFKLCYGVHLKKLI